MRSNILLAEGMEEEGRKGTDKEEDSDTTKDRPMKILHAAFVNYTRKVLEYAQYNPKNEETGEEEDF